MKQLVFCLSALFQCHSKLLSSRRFADYLRNRDYPGNPLVCFSLFGFKCLFWRLSINLRWDLSSKCWTLDLRTISFRHSGCISWAAKSCFYLQRISYQLAASISVTLQWLLVYRTPFVNHRTPVYKSFTNQRNRSTINVCAPNSNDKAIRSVLIGGDFKIRNWSFIKSLAHMEQSLKVPRWWK